MTQFVSLPSGLVVNLELINRMIPSDEQGEPLLTVHFSTGDFIVLRSQDATVLRNRAGVSGGGLSSNVKTIAFWVVILAAVLLVWMAVRTAPR
jgi:predicted outer membrane repeat protein